MVQMQCGSGKGPRAVWVMPTVTSVMSAMMLTLAGCSDGGARDTGAWNPTEPTAGGTGDDDGGAGDDDDGDDDGGPGDGNADNADGGEEGEEGGNEGVEPQCEPGTEEPCLCPDGLHLGDQTCDPDGFWGACINCDDAVDDGMDAPDDDASETTGDDGDDDGGGMPTEVCYPGDNGDYTTCLPLHYFTAATMPSGYDYPGVLNGDQNYRDPIALIDLEENPPETKLSPNFRLDEIAQLFKGRWAIVQVHAVESLQGLRDEVGAITVNSGYRSPTYNASVDGAAYSRHMFGDGFDLDPVSVGLSTLEAACTSSGGMLVEYNTHVHCDFRFDDVDEEFFGPAPAAAAVAAPVTYAADLVEDALGGWTAPVSGFDEGEPRRRWQAFDAHGELIATGSGTRFVPPPSARSLEVRVGRVLDLSVEL